MVSPKRKHALTLAKMTQNAYRVLGLSVNASESTIFKKAESLKRKARLGNPESMRFGIDLLEELVPNEREIQSAVNKLMNPKQRVQERLFWFSDQNDWLINDFAEQCADVLEYLKVYNLENDSLDDVLSIHEKSLIGLLFLSVDDFEFEIASAWQTVYNLLCTTLADEGFWKYQWKFEEQGSFTRPIGNEIEESKQKAYSFILEPLMSIIEEHINQDDMEAASRGILILSCIDIPSTLRNELTNSYLFIIEDEVNELCKSITDGCRNRINKDKDRSDNATLNNLNICRAAADLYEMKVVPKVDLILKSKAPIQPLIEKRIYDYICDFKHLLGIYYTWGRDFSTADKLLKEAKEIATDLSKLKEIEATIEEIWPGGQKSQITVMSDSSSNTTDNIMPGQYVRNINTEETFIVLKCKGEYVTVKRRDGKHITFKAKNLEIIEDWEYEEDKSYGNEHNASQEEDLENNERDSENSNDNESANSKENDDSAGENVKDNAEGKYDKKEDSQQKTSTNDISATKKAKDGVYNNKNEKQSKRSAKEEDGAKEEGEKSVLYERSHKDSEYNGYGMYIWTSGSKYTGNWKDGKPHGWGVYTWSSGDKYGGEWEYGKRHGKGTFISSNGFVSMGVWEEDVLKEAFEDVNLYSEKSITFMPGQNVYHVKTGEVYIVYSIIGEFVWVKKSDNSFLEFNVKHLRLYDGNKRTQKKNISGYLWVAVLILLYLILGAWSFGGL